MSNQTKTEKLQQAIKNTSEQLNPNNVKYWQSRGFDERPENWKQLIEQTAQAEKL